jgi:transposase
LKGDALRPAQPETVEQAEQVEAAHAQSDTAAELAEIVADKGYHSNQTMVDLAAVEVRSYIAEPERGRRDWAKTPEAQRPVYGNRRRVRGARGKRLLRRRGEYVERSFAHVYDTGGLRRTHLRGHQNILKRLLVHAGAFNLGLLMRQAFGRGTPRGLQGRRFVPGALEIAFGMLVARVWMAATRLWPVSRSLPHVLSPSWTAARAC